jgi:hypothetical protein
MPDLVISPINKVDAVEYMKKNSSYRGDFDLAISVKEGEVTHGVICLRADGKEFSLCQVSTDGNAFIGSLLYGAAWRTAKALGYKSIII